MRNGLFCQVAGARQLARASVGQYLCRKNVGCGLIRSIQEVSMKMFPRILLFLCLAMIFPMLTPGFAAGMSMGPVPTDLDYATTRTSENGLYKVSFTSREVPIPVNKMHSWQLRVEDPNGQPVSDAVISVSGGMPQHGHGLPTQPRVTENLGNGDFLVEGLKFQMHGWWVVTFDISSAAGNDKVTFNLKL
jgi:hypothetical protein